MPEALVPPALRDGFLRGVWKEIAKEKKKFIMEVKTVKTVKKYQDLSPNSIVHNSG